MTLDQLVLALLVAFVVGAFAIAQYHGDMHQRRLRHEISRYFYMWREAADAIRLPLRPTPHPQLSVTSQAELTRNATVLHLRIEPLACAVSWEIRSDETLHIISRNATNDFLGYLQPEVDRQIFRELLNGSARIKPRR